MRTRRSVMLVERSVETGRIAKNEEYSIDEFAKMMTPVVEIKASWFTRLFDKKEMERQFENILSVFIKDRTNWYIDKDNFGRKRK